MPHSEAVSSIKLLKRGVRLYLASRVNMSYEASVINLVEIFQPGASKGVYYLMTISRKILQLNIKSSYYFRFFYRLLQVLLSGLEVDRQSPASRVRA